MDYVPRQGIIKSKLCGRYVLIPSRSVSDKCKSILHLTGRSLVIWTGIECDYPFEKVLEMYMFFSKLSRQEAEERIDAFCKALLEKGFIIPK